MTKLNQSNQLDLGFKYHIGHYVTHKDDLESTRQPIVPHYTVVSQLLETSPSGPQRRDYLSPTEETHREHIRSAEAHIVPVPEEDI